MPTQPNTAAQPGGGPAFGPNTPPAGGSGLFGGVFDAKPASPPDVEQVLQTHTSRLEEMADKAEADRDHADEQARAWNRAAGTHDRLARGYRKALEYLAQQAPDHQEQQ